MVRIISGYHKGRQIKTNRNPQLRPTADRVKETLFNILGDMNNLKVIDLFAGSGNLGLEALSRGAASCIMVEKNYKQLILIRENVVKMDLADRVEIRNMDVLKFLPESPDADLILADPPYSFSRFDRLFDLLTVTYADARIVVEAGRDLKIPERLSEVVETHRSIGGTSLIIMKV